MKRLFILGLLALAGCGNADKANDALPVKELMAKSKTELTAEQWNVKKTLFKVLTEFDGKRLWEEAAKNTLGAVPEYAE